MSVKTMKILLIICSILLLITIFFIVSDRLFYMSFVKKAKEIRAENKNADPELITEESLGDLPEVVARYIRYSGLVGKKKMQAVRLVHSGSFRPAANKDFFPVRGEYYITANKPSFCWYGKISMAPGLSVAAFDSYYKGHGRMRIKIMSAFTLSDEQSEYTNKSSFGRMVTEMTMIPSCFLDSERITWTKYDSAEAECIFRDAGMQTNALFSFNAEGALEKIEVYRYYSTASHPPTLEKFTGILHGKRSHDRILLPEIFDGYWKLKTGDLHYVHFVVDSVEYE
jgi:hypothetical protein